MSKQKAEYAGTSWADVAEAVSLWEATYGVRICAQLTWDKRLSAGACVEVTVYDGLTVGRGPELVRVREAFPARKGAGQAGSVLWAVSCALAAMEREPWTWSSKMRREAQKTA